MGKLKNREDYKICVYAICKNESEFVDRWMNSIKDEADYIAVLDTGSTDDTYEKFLHYAETLEKPKVIVKQFDYMEELGYFRFDKARNDSLKLVPPDADICMVFDLDHVIKPGWSEIVREEFSRGYKEIYGILIDHDNGEEVTRWETRNCHPNDPFYVWTKAIHECLEYYGTEPNPVYREDFVMYHYPNRQKDRSLYKKLLEQVVEEEPTNPYYYIHLGIELSLRYSNYEALNVFKKALDVCDFKGNEQYEYQICINIANITDDVDEALMALDRAKNIPGVKDTRRIYLAYSNTYEKAGDYPKAVEALEQALINVRTISTDWTDDAFLYQGYIEDKLSLFYFNTPMYNPYKAIEYCARALQLDPNNERIKANLYIFVKQGLGCISSN